MHTFDSIGEIYASTAGLRTVGSSVVAVVDGMHGAQQPEGTTSFKARAACRFVHYLWVSCMRAKPSRPRAELHRESRHK